MTLTEATSGHKLKFQAAYRTKSIKGSLPFLEFKFGFDNDSSELIFHSNVQSMSLEFDRQPAVFFFLCVFFKKNKKKTGPLHFFASCFKTFCKWANE